MLGAARIDQEESSMPGPLLDGITVLDFTRVQ